MARLQHVWATKGVFGSKRGDQLFKKHRDAILKVWRHALDATALTGLDPAPINQLNASAGQEFVKHA